MYKKRDWNHMSLWTRLKASKLETNLRSICTNFLTTVLMGKHMSQGQWMLIRIIRNYQATMREIIAFELKSYKIFEENLLAFTSNPKKVYWDVPTVVGASVFESKFHMYRFHHGILKTNFEYQLLCSDTNSLLYETKKKRLIQRNFRKRNILNDFDLSN